ncbi:MAG: hypothetical protein V4733_11090 [Verrucomicrobiota bacterium]
MIDANSPQETIEKKKEYETERELVEELKLKLIAEAIDTRIPMEIVVVHQAPAIGEAPVSPNVMLNLVFGSAAGFVVGLLIGIPIAIMVERKPVEAYSR